MNLHEAMTRYRTLVLEGRDGIDRSGLLACLARHGFLIRRTARTLHHVDPTQPFREALAGPGRLAVDGGIVRELVYGPLRRGHSRVTWIQALDLAEAVAERNGALLHVTRPLTAHVPLGEAGPEQAEAHDASAAYVRALRTLAQHVPVVIVHLAETAGPAGDPGRSARPPGPARRRAQHSWAALPLTVG